MQHEINLAAQCLLCLYKQIFKVCHVGSISRDNDSICLLCQFVNCSHTAGYGCVCQCYLGTLFHCAFCHLPCYRLVIECTEDDARSEEHPSELQSSDHLV